jgi:hypothetical protein
VVVDECRDLAAEAPFAAHGLESPPIIVNRGYSSANVPVVGSSKKSPNDSKPR